MKKGFTLVELLAVLVIMIIIGGIGTAGVTGVNKAINKNMYESNIKLIETAAVKLGEDRLVWLYDETCDNGKSACTKTTVNYLIEHNYIKTKETDSNGKKVLINYTLEKSDPNYYLNDHYVYIWIENNLVYSDYIE